MGHRKGMEVPRLRREGRCEMIRLEGVPMAAPLTTSLANMELCAPPVVPPWPIDENALHEAYLDFGDPIKASAFFEGLCAGLLVAAVLCAEKAGARA